MITLQSCTNQRIKDLFEKKPDPPQLFLLERKKKWKRHRKIPGNNRYVQKLSKRNVAKRELRYSNGLCTFVCWLHWKDLFHRSYKQLKSFMYERVNLTFYPYFRTASARHFLVLLGWWDGFIIPFNRCRGYSVKFEHENNSNRWYPNVIQKKKLVLCLQSTKLTFLLN